MKTSKGKKAEITNQDIEELLERLNEIEALIRSQMSFAEKMAYDDRTSPHGPVKTQI